MKLLITRIAFVMAFAAVACGPRALRAEPRPAAPQSQPGDPLLAIPPPGSPELSAYCARVKSLHDAALYDLYLEFLNDPDARSDGPHATACDAVSAEVASRSEHRLAEYLARRPPPDVADLPKEQLFLLLQGSIDYAPPSAEGADAERRRQEIEPIVRRGLQAGGYPRHIALQAFPHRGIAWMDDRLIRELLPEVGREGRERLLAEIVRRGGAGWEWALAGELERVGRLEPIESQMAGALEIRTALRRVQGKPDPLRVRVEGPGKLECTIPRLPDLTVSLVAGTTEAPIRIEEGDGNSGRWRIEATDAGGKIMPVRDGPETPSAGLVSFTTLQPGGTWGTSLHTREFLDALPPGKYAIRVLYHDRIEIDQAAAPHDLILFTSAPVELSVNPLVIDEAHVKPALVHRLVDQTVETHELKVVGGTYGPWAYDLVRPWSAQGELLSLGYPAIPPLLNELADPRLKPDRRAVVLSVLFSLTGQNDPRVDFTHGTSPDMDVLGDLDGVDGTWTALGEGERRGQVGHEHIENEQIDEAKQKEFASRWDRWKDFIRIAPHPQTRPAP